MGTEVEKEEEEEVCHPGVVGGATLLVKQVEEGQVFEAPEAVMQQMVWVSAEEEEASRCRRKLSGWSAPPPVVAVAERDVRL